MQIATPRVFEVAPRALLLSAALALPACGGGGDDGVDADLQGCTSISGGGTQVSFTSSAGCPSCASADNARAADGNFDSAATMQMGPGGAATIELRVTAQDGVIFPSGSSVGLAYSLATDAQAGLTPSFVTYLNGVQQETRTSSVNGVGSGSGQKQSTQFRANRQFDAVAFSVNRAGSAGSLTAQFFEACTGR